MEELGRVMHVARSGRIIVKVNANASEKRSTGMLLVDSSGLRIGKIQEIFGPVFSPYASVLPSREKLTGIIGKKVFIADEDSFRRMKFKRYSGHKAKHKHESYASSRARKYFSN
jgi:RNA-binding protein